MPTDDPAEAESNRYGRRIFLGVMGAGVSSLWWGDTAWNAAARALSPITRNAPQALRDALPSPSSGWRIYAVNPPMPKFDPATWRLRVDGLVENPLELSFDELRALPRVDQTSDFHCVTGWSVPDVRWAGVRIADLLALARPAPEAGALAFVSAEQPYVDSLTIEQATLPDALLAYEMDGRPITRPHGAPTRMVIPAMYGYKGVKWLNRIVVTRRQIVGFWEQRGYDQNAWVGRSNGLA